MTDRTQPRDVTAVLKRAYDEVRGVRLTSEEVRAFIEMDDAIMARLGVGPYAEDDNDG